MNIIFLSLSSAVANIENRGIYPDLLRAFLNNGHNIYIVCPNERKDKIWKTYLTEKAAVKTLHVLTPNYTKTNIFEKALALLSINALYWRSIKAHFSNVDFDLILYATPPITFTPIIKKLKKKNGAFAYLMLKDIFPQNAIDLGFINSNSLIAKYFRRKEERLYRVSDHIGCMSPANKAFVLENNPFLHPSKVGVCPNSIELKKRPSIERDKVRDQYSLPNDKVIAVYGGNLGKPQGIPFLLEVLNANKDEPQVFFVIAGNGTEFSKIRTFLENSSIPNVLLIPALPRNSFDELVQACDIGLVFLDKRFTIPNFPSRILNYMEFKLPILFATDKNTDVGRIAEQNGFGMWSESGELIAFNVNLNRLTSDYLKRKEMGEKALRYLVSNYLVDDSYKIIMSTINQI